VILVLAATLAAVVVVRLKDVRRHLNEPSFLAVSYDAARAHVPPGPPS
jgi:hypothetical protein